MKSDKEGWYEVLIATAQRDPQVENIDLHGMRVDTALREVDQFFHHALYHNIPVVKIICGVGSGALSDAVNAYSQKHELVGRVLSKGSEIFVAIK